MSDFEEWTPAEDEPLELGPYDGDPCVCKHTEYQHRLTYDSYSGEYDLEECLEKDCKCEGFDPAWQYDDDDDED